MSVYKCVARDGCGKEFVKLNPQAHRFATARFIECCGAVAMWKRYAPDEVNP